MASRTEQVIKKRLRSKWSSLDYIRKNGNRTVTLRPRFQASRFFDRGLDEWHTYAPEDAAFRLRHEQIRGASELKSKFRRTVSVLGLSRVHDQLLNQLWHGD